MKQYKVETVEQTTDAPIRRGYDVTINGTTQDAIDHVQKQFPNQKVASITPDDRAKAPAPQASQAQQPTQAELASEIIHEVQELLSKPATPANTVTPANPVPAKA